MATGPKRRKKKDPRGRPPIPESQRSRPVAFRLPPDIVKLADRAAKKQHLSRNKLVELTLRAALEPKEPADDRQIDLFQ